jgi:hypothetical protein
MERKKCKLELGNKKMHVFCGNDDAPVDNVKISAKLRGNNGVVFLDAANKGSIPPSRSGQLLHWAFVNHNVSETISLIHAFQQLQKGACGRLSGTDCQKFWTQKSAEK